jgi:hypothetical protein
MKKHRTNKQEKYIKVLSCVDTSMQQIKLIVHFKSYLFAYKVHTNVLTEKLNGEQYWIHPRNSKVLGIA